MKSAHQITDRAKRYRANRTRKVGTRCECTARNHGHGVVCRSRRNLGIGHKDGDESNGRDSNLFTVCKSCNAMQAADDKRRGRGMRTRQYNPTRKQLENLIRVAAAEDDRRTLTRLYVENRIGRRAFDELVREGRQMGERYRKNPGATNLAQYVQAAVEHSRGAHDAGGKVIHETPKAKRREFAREIAFRKGYRNPRGRVEGELEVAEKSPHTEVSYEPHSKHKPEACLNCRNFIPSDPPRCLTVKSPISPKAYCERYAPKESANPRRRNPDSDELYRKFHGARPDNHLSLSVPLVDPYGEHPEVGQLGLLVRLVVGEGVKVHWSPNEERVEAIEDDHWVREIVFVESMGKYARWQDRTRTQSDVDQLKHWLRQSGTPDVAGAPVERARSRILSKQLYIVGGNQDIDDKLAEMGADPEKEILDIGFVYLIEYYTQKGFDRMQPIDYNHVFGEKHGDPPRLIYYRKPKLLQFAGGDYTVTSRGIEN